MLEGLTTGEIFSPSGREVYGTSLSKKAISKVTYAVIEEMTDRVAQPALERVYRLVFIDAIVVKVLAGAPAAEFGYVNVLHMVRPL